METTCSVVKAQQMANDNSLIHASNMKPRPVGASPFVTAMMLQRLNPRTDFQCDTIELVKLMFSADDEASATELGVKQSEWLAWKTGKKSVPKVVWLYLRQKRDMTLPEKFGVWRGFTVDGERLVSPWGDAVAFDELPMMTEYRRAADLSRRQAEMIERLMTERNFYRENCHRQAKFGLMVNNLFRDES